MNEPDPKIIDAIAKLHGMMTFRPLRSDYFGDDGPAFRGRTPDEILDAMERNGCWFGVNGRETMRALIVAEQAKEPPA